MTLARRGRFSMNTVGRKQNAICLSQRIPGLTGKNTVWLPAMMKLDQSIMKTSMTFAQSPIIDLDVQDVPMIAIISPHGECCFRQNIARRLLHVTP